MAKQGLRLDGLVPWMAEGVDDVVVIEVGIVLVAAWIFISCTVLRTTTTYVCGNTIGGISIVSLALV